MSKEIEAALYRTELEQRLALARKRRDYRLVHALELSLKKARTAQLQQEVDALKNPKLKLFSFIKSLFKGGIGDTARKIKEVDKVANGNTPDALQFKSATVLGGNPLEKDEKFKGVTAQ